LHAWNGDAFFEVIRARHSLQWRNRRHHAIPRRPLLHPHQGAAPRRRARKWGALHASQHRASELSRSTASCLMLDKGDLDGMFTTVALRHPDVQAALDQYSAVPGLPECHHGADASVHRKEGMGVTLLSGGNRWTQLQVTNALVNALDWAMMILAINPLTGLHIGVRAEGDEANRSSWVAGVFGWKGLI
jgi:hypothetical protein